MLYCVQHNVDKFRNMNVSLKSGDIHTTLRCNRDKSLDTFVLHPLQNIIERQPIVAHT